MANTEFDTQYYAYLAKRIREKDGDAFAELYRATYQTLYRYSCYFLKDPHLAQDALQEIYISVYKNISSLKSDKLLLPWIKQITYHTCCDYSRKVMSSPSEVSDFTEDVNLINLADKEDCFQHIFDRDFADSLKDALAELPPFPRQAFVLRFKNELKLEEIADFMNCSLSSVKRYIKTAQKHLQKKLAQYL